MSRERALQAEETAWLEAKRDWCVCVCVSVFKMVQDGLVRAKCSGVKRGMVHC